MSRQQALRIVLLGLGVIALIILFYVGRGLVSRPATAFAYVVVAGIAVAAIRYVVMPRAKFSRCPDCGRALMTHDTVHYGGGKSNEGETLPALIERRYLCQDCNFRIYKLIEEDPKKIDAVALQKAKKKGTISSQAWQEIRNEVEMKVATQNEKKKDTGKEWTF